MQHAHDNDIGVAVIDAFTHYVLQFMEKINKTSQVSMQELVRSKKKKIVSTQTDLCHFFQFDSIDVTKISSHHGVRSDLFKRPLDKTRITDFFGGVAQVEVVDQPADSIPTALVMEDSPPLIEIPEQQKPPINILLPPSSSRMATAISGLFTWLGDWRLERTWASVGFIGVLVGWVVFKR